MVKPEAVTILDLISGMSTVLKITALWAAEQGMKYIRLAPGALVTPLARDVAWEKGIELIFPDGKNERR